MYPLLLIMSVYPLGPASRYPPVLYTDTVCRKTARGAPTIRAIRKKPGEPTRSSVRPARRCARARVVGYGVRGGAWGTGYGGWGTGYGVLGQVQCIGVLGQVQCKLR